MQQNTDDQPQTQSAASSSPTNQSRRDYYDIDGRGVVHFGSRAGEAHQQVVETDRTYR